MSYANGTTHYNLPQTVGTDKRDWFDSNAAFAAVDAALYAAATGQASDAEAITALQQTVAGQATDIAALQTASSSQAASISALQTTVNGQATQIADVRQDAEDMITANNEGAAATSTRAYAVGDYFIYNDVLYKATAAIAIGDTIIPNTNCIATNVDTELTQINSELHDDVTIHTFTNSDITSNNYIGEVSGSIIRRGKRVIVSVRIVGNDNLISTMVQLTNSINIGGTAIHAGSPIIPVGFQSFRETSLSLYINAPAFGVQISADGQRIFLVGIPAPLGDGTAYSGTAIFELE